MRHLILVLTAAFALAACDPFAPIGSPPPHIPPVSPGPGVPMGGGGYDGGG